MKSILGGSFEYYDPTELSTSAAPTTLMTVHTGFRLAHDDAERVERGGSCLLDSFQVGQARGYRVNPAFQSAARGFRLTREDT